MDFLDIVLRWAHMIGAMLLSGGIVYQWFVIGKRTPSSSTESTNDAERRRWSVVVMIAITLLLVSGLANAALVSIRYELGMDYNALLGVKLVLALAVFYLASVLSGRSAAAQRMRASKQPWLTWLAILSVLVVMIGSVMKNLEHNEKQPDDDDENNVVQTTLDRS